jgi:hypothetical protein
MTYPNSDETSDSLSRRRLSRSTVAKWLATLLFAAAAPTVRADSSLVMWGSNADGQCNPPANLGPIRKLATGYQHSAALTTDRTVRCWGSNNSGQCNVPAALTDVVQVDTGVYHNIALRSTGEVYCWGSNDYGQCSVPSGLGPMVEITAGFYHSMARRPDGSVSCWGWNEFGQCAVPTNLGATTAMDGGISHSMALRLDGSVICWGSNAYGQCAVPTSLGSATAIAAGEIHSMALKSDGTVVCWGSNGTGQCNVPSGLGQVDSVAAGAFHSFARRTDGTVACWGASSDNCPIPSQVQSCATIVTGYYHSAAVVCVAPTYSGTSGNLGSIGSGSPRQHTFNGLNAAAGTAVLTVRVQSDLNLVTEFLSLRVNGTPLSNLFVETGADCPAVPEVATVSFTAKQFNALAASGSLTVSIDASAGVNPAQCSVGTCEILLGYPEVPVDCNSNGIEDGCEVTGFGRDCNSNGAPDDCDLASGSSHDVDADGTPDECQLDCNANQIPDEYEIDTGLTADCNQNALPDACEVADPGPNLVGNGGFDSGAGGWTVSNVDGSGGWRSSGGHPGGMLILNDGGGATDPTIEQTISGLAPGTTYAISGDFIGGSQANSPSGAISFAVDLNGATLFNAPATDTTNWRNFSATFVAASTSAQLRLRAEINGTDNDFAVDNIAVFIASSAPDCNDNGVPDSCDIAAGAAADCNANSIPDSCDIARGTSADVDSNGVPDTCQTDCNANALPDSYEIAQNPSRDCNSNAQLDSCEIAANPALDCDLNGKLDSCDVQEPFADCDGNGKLDRCDIAQGAQDKDFDGWIDACEIARGDFNLDGEVNGADLAELLSLWGFPDPPYGDLNGDGVVNAPDLSIFLGNWGTIPWPDFSRLFIEPNGVFEVPAGVTSVRVLLVGGGGGGANGHMGGGGSGFVYATVVSVVPGQQIPVVVGRGGLGAQTTNDNSIIGNTAGSMSAFGSTNSVSGGDTPNGGQGAAGGSGGGGSCNSGNPGGAGGTAGSNGLVPPCGTAGGLGQGSSFATNLSMFWRRQVSSGAGGAGGTSTHSAGGGGGGVLINGIGPTGSDGAQSFSGRGGHGFGGGGGGGGYQDGQPLRFAGGSGAQGVVYIEW